MIKCMGKTQWEGKPRCKNFATQGRYCLIHLKMYQRRKTQKPKTKEEKK